MVEQHAIQSGELVATVAAKGAELVSLKSHTGLEVIWQAGPEWPRHAPVLFPIVGRLNDDRLEVDGRDYRLRQHGFARDRTFVWSERNTDCCTLTLEDDPDTHAMYPFPFRLDVSYQVDGSRLTIAFDVSNPGDRTLPVSVGAHPAFNWPLDRSLAKTDYFVEFEKSESAPIRRLTDGLLQPEPHQSPVQGRRLDLAEDLFTADAIIFDRLASRSLRYRATSGPMIDVSWTGFTELGLWSKPCGAPFLCIEPWHGYASPIGFAGAFSDKPGLMHLAPGEKRRLALCIDVTGANA